MAAFRKLMPAFAVLALVLGLVSTARADTTFQCTATTGTATPLIRAEGLTELTGDIVLNCSGGTPTTNLSQIPMANISVYLNTAVTSRLLNTSTNVSEALLMVGDPAVGQQLVCSTVPTTTCPVLGTSTVSSVPGNDPFKPYTNTLGTSITPYNIWPGVVSGNQVTFTGIPIEPPGSTANRLYRITNIRANASTLATGGSSWGTVTALVSTTPITSGASFTISNSTQTLGYVQTGLTFAVYAFSNVGSTTVPTIKQCSNYRYSSSVPTGLMLARFTENFASSFKPRSATSYSAFAGVDVSPTPLVQATPGLIYNSESGFYNPSLTSPFNLAGLADFGTRLRVSFSSIPNGVSLFVTTTNVTVSSSTGYATASTPSNPTSSSARLVGSESGYFYPVAASGTVTLTVSNSLTYSYYPITLSSGAGLAVWEVMGTDPAITETMDFGILALATANATNNLPAAGLGYAAGSFAPAPTTAFTASSGASAQGSSYPVPRFADTGSAKKIMTVALCRTILLFPFVTNQAGFDTGIAIANTTTDPLGVSTSAQTGTCDVNFYNGTTQAAFTTPSIATGTVYANTIASMNSGFQGYLIAVCNFQYAHGFAFITDVGARNLAMGYLALVIPDGGRANVSSGVSLANGTGEVLGQ